MIMEHEDKYTELAAAEVPQHAHVYSCHFACALIFMHVVDVECVLMIIHVCPMSMCCHVYIHVS